MAKVFGKNNYNFVFVVKRFEAMTELKRQFPNIDINIQKDLSLVNSCLEVFDEVNKANINVDILVNKAGFGDTGEFHTLSKEKA
jgi:uncharacterized protein